MSPNNPYTGSVCQSDDPVFGSSGSASTPVENIALIGYFEEIRDLIRKKPVKIHQVMVIVSLGRYSPIMISVI
jgi:hypothetical protein